MTKLNERRRARGFTSVAKFAEACGLPLGKTEKLVKGEEVPLTNDDIIALARVLDMRFHEAEDALREKPPTPEQMKLLQDENVLLKREVRSLGYEIAAEKQVHQLTAYQRIQ